MYRFDVFEKDERNELNLVLTRSFESTLEMTNALMSAFLLFGFKNYEYSVYYDGKKS